MLGVETASLDWVGIGQMFGVPIICLIGLSFAVWRSLNWIGLNIAKPVADRHVKFLDELSTAMASQAQALQTMAIHQGKNLDGMQEVLKYTEQLLKSTKQLLKSTEEIIEQQDSLKTANVESMRSILEKVDTLLSKQNELVLTVTEFKSRIGQMDIHADSVTLHSSTSSGVPAHGGEKGVGL